MSRPRQYTDDAILEATLQCVLEHGPAVSTMTIADRAGMSQAALFKRFGTKERLLVAALLRPPRELPIIDLIRAGPGPEPIRDQLETLGTALIAMFRRIVPCLTMLHAAGVDTQDALSRPDSPAILGRKAITSWLATAQSTGRIGTLDTSCVAVAFIGMLQARPFREQVVGDMVLTCTDAEYVHQVIALIWSGLTPEQTT